MSTIIDYLVVALDEAYDHKSWHGTNLRGSLKGLSVERLSWRPQSNRHNIWEIAVHAAYWKYVVRRRLLREQRGSFPLQGSDWFQRPLEPLERAWRLDLAVLGDQHRQLREALLKLEEANLEVPLTGSRVTPGFLIRGVIAHDLYHAGQIQLLKRLQKNRSSS